MAGGDGYAGTNGGVGPIGAGIVAIADGDVIGATGSRLADRDRGLALGVCIVTKGSGALAMRGGALPEGRGVVRVGGRGLADRSRVLATRRGVIAHRGGIVTGCRRRVADGGRLSARGRRIGTDGGVARAGMRAVADGDRVGVVGRRTLPRAGALQHAATQRNAVLVGRAVLATDGDRVVKSLDALAGIDVRVGLHRTGEFGLTVRHLALQLADDGATELDADTGSFDDVSGDFHAELGCGTGDRFQDGAGEIGTDTRDVQAIGDRIELLGTEASVAAVVVDVAGDAGLHQVAVTHAACVQGVLVVEVTLVGGADVDDRGAAGTAQGPMGAVLVDKVAARIVGGVADNGAAQVLARGVGQRQRIVLLFVARMTVGIVGDVVDGVLDALRGDGAARQAVARLVEQAGYGTRTLLRDVRTREQRGHLAVSGWAVGVDGVSKRRTAAPAS